VLAERGYKFSMGPGPMLFEISDDGTVIDLVPFYPEFLVTSVSRSIRDYYITSYRDRFFLQPPNWFKVYIGLEGLYHMPITLWFLKALPNEDPLLPLHLLVFALETGITTLTCLVEMLSWEGYTKEEVGRLSTLYGPYLGFGTLIWRPGRSGTDVWQLCSWVWTRSCG
jgi:EXPERA (EXPanded EBP superfamily)